MKRTPAQVLAIKEWNKTKNTHRGPFGIPPSTATAGAYLVNGLSEYQKTSYGNMLNFLNAMRCSDKDTLLQKYKYWDEVYAVIIYGFSIA